MLSFSVCHSRHHDEARQWLKRIRVVSFDCPNDVWLARASRQLGTVLIWEFTGELVQWYETLSYGHF